MSSNVVQLADFRSLRRPNRAPVRVPAEGSHASASDRFLFWAGASGKRYVHTIHALVDCPELPAANFVLVRREPNGHRSILAIGRVMSTCAALNLAEIRQRGAQLGAHEVHVHLLAFDAQDSKRIEFDLRTGQFRNGRFVAHCDAGECDDAGAAAPTMH